MTDVCNNFANFGMSCFSKQRLLFMIATTVLCVFSVISALIAWFGNSDDDDTVKNCAWTIFADDVSGVTLDWYFGTFKYVHESDTLQGDNLSYEQCIEFDPFFDDDYYYTTFCRDCKDAGITANNCTVVTLIILAFLVGLSMARMLLQDRWLYKIAFVAMSLVNILVITIGLGSWDDQCVQEHIEDDLSSVGDVFIGPGMWGYILSFCFMFVATLIHLLTPVSQSVSTAGGATAVDQNDQK